MSSFNSDFSSPNELQRKARARFFLLFALASLFLVFGLAVALTLRSNIDASSYDPLVGVWKSVDGRTMVEFTSQKTMVEKDLGSSNSVTYQVRVDDPNTLILTAPGGSTRQVDWLISEEGVLALVSGENALTYRR